jgi:two-component system cell cycle response regulator
MDGFEVCSRVKTEPKTAYVKVLAVIGFATDENIQKMLHAGADDYLTKPVSMEDLLAKVNDLLAAHD